MDEITGNRGGGDVGLGLNGRISCKERAFQVWRLKPSPWGCNTPICFGTKSTKKESIS